jgi:hypothetical protein
LKSFEGEVDLRTEVVNEMYIRSLKAMQINFTFRTKLTKTDEIALLDSGASENFIDMSTWEELGIGRIKLPRPIPVRNVDGTSNKLGAIEYFCWLKIKMGRQEEEMKFYLTNIGKERFILGYPFLWTFNPTIDWRTNEIQEGDIEIGTIGPRGDHWTPSKETNEGRALYVRKTTTAQIWAQRTRERQGKLKETKIPEEYERHWKVFDEKSAQRFPPERAEDMKIDLLPGAPPSINCKVYPLNQKETKILKEFLEEERRKGYIKPGSSPYTAPVFFVGKKDSEELRRSDL